MACRLVGSVPPSASLDPEDVHAQVVAFHEIVTDVASHFGGFPAQCQGYALIYFGYPTAGKQDAEQTIRASLAILASLGKRNASFGAEIHAGLGIATGTVVIDEQPGTGEALRGVAIGEVPSQAPGQEARCSRASPSPLRQDVRSPI